MSYESPIRIMDNSYESVSDAISKHFAEGVDNLIVDAVVNVGVHVDKDELEKALRYDRGQYEKGYEDGKRDAVAAIEALQAQLPKQGEIVRCGECRYRITAHGISDGWVLCSKPYTERGNAMHRADWFCADGEREVQE